jgi:Uma2 family endonuclease
MSTIQAATVRFGAALDVRRWGEMPEDNPGELVEGRLVEEEMPNQVHEVVVIFIASVLRAWLVPRRGFVGGSNAKFAIADDRGRKPDAYAFFPGTPMPPPAASVSEVPPDLMVEVVSTSPADARRDRIEKLGEYARFGVRYYWIVDPTLRSVEILELGASGRYEHACVATQGVIERVPGCEGLALDIDALWREVDRLIDAAGRA